MLTRTLHVRGTPEAMTARIPRPFEGVYGISPLTAILALVPYIMVTSACALFSRAGIAGHGAGATVSPGLYLAAFPLPSRLVGRIFARVELVRPVADFILAPVMLGVARVARGAAMGSPPLAQTLRGS